MTPLDLTQCPPPEKFGPWRSMPSDTFITTGDIGRVRVRAVPGWGWKIDAEYCGTTFGCEAHTDADLPSAYRRALQAVGLASPWTSEVPTTPGDYLLNDSNGERSYLWTLADGRWSTATESGRVSNNGGWAPFTRFMPCPQPPKERP